MLKETISALVIAAILAGGTLYYINYETGKIHISQVSIKEIDFDEKGFSVKADIKVENPTMFNVKIDSIAYRMYLEKTGETLVEGGQEDIDVRAYMGTTILLDEKVDWKPTIDTALNLVKDKEVNIVVEGIALSSWWVFEKKTKFKFEYDIKPFIEQFVEEKTKSFGELLGEFL